MGNERGAGAIEFRVLGPLEARIGGEELALGGAKQRAVLAVLLLRAGEVVPVERFVEEVWGDDPPPSAAHTLESYVSRLRQVFNGHGLRLVRRGPGYCLDLAGATLDARTFLELNEEARVADLEGDHTRVVRVTASALGVWRGPALADVVFASAGRADADRFEELRLGTHELRFDALLALGRHEQVVGEVQPLVRQNPYRERFVAQLMLALYRSGRHAEALDVYEKLRVSLDGDLGLQPSAELRKLSARIVRQEPFLRWSATSDAKVAPRSPIARRPRADVLVAAGAAVCAALALATSGGAAVPENATPKPGRLALVLPGPYGGLGLGAKGVSTAVARGKIIHRLEATQTVIVDPRVPQNDVDAVAARIRNGGVGIVVAFGDGPAMRALAGSVRRLPETRFVFVDASLRELSLHGVPNAAAIRFADEDVIYLAGYLSGLVPTMDGSANRVDAVSVVAGKPTRDTARLIAAYRRGLRSTRPGVAIRVAYSRELEDPTACERLANRQIDGGSDVLFAVAGRCGLGASAVARIRGVWSIGAVEDGVFPDDHVLMSTHKEWELGTLHAIEELVEGTLPMGRDTVLGLEDDYFAGLEMSYDIPSDIESAVVRRCSRIRAVKHRDLD